MKKAFFSLMMVAMLALVACAPPIAIGGTQPSVSNEVATVVAMTMQAITPEAATTPTNVPEASTSLLPHSLYFLGRDSQAISQVYRIEQDGKTKTQLTFEPVSVDEYDVSLADGSVAYIVSNQLLLINTDGSNRRVLVDGGPREGSNPWVTSPVFSPDGQTLAYDHKGLNLYSVSTSVSNLVIENQYGDVEIINGVERALPIETYRPGKYSPDGTKLFIHLLYTDTSSTAIYDPAGDTLVRLTGKEDTLECCGLYREIEWSADSSSF